MKLESSRQILEKVNIPNFIKIRPVGAELLYADGRDRHRDMLKLVVVFRNFAKALKMNNNKQDKIFVLFLYHKLALWEQSKETGLDWTGLDWTITKTPKITLHDSLSSCSKVLLEKKVIPELVKKFPKFYGTRKFITSLTKARHLSLSKAT